MAVFQKLGDLILSSWIWQFTYDWYHIVNTGIIMFFLLRIIMKRTRKRAFIVSLMAQLVSMAMLSFIALVVLVRMFDWQFAPMNPTEGVKQIAFFYPSMMLGLIYAILQTIFFAIASFFWNINLLGFVIITWISNLFGAMISYMFIHMSEIMKYVG